MAVTAMLHGEASKGRHQSGIWPGCRVQGSLFRPCVEAKDWQLLWLAHMQWQEWCCWQGSAFECHTVGMVM